METNSKISVGQKLYHKHGFWAPWKSKSVIAVTTHTLILEGEIKVSKATYKSKNQQYYSKPELCPKLHGAPVYP